MRLFHGTDAANIDSINATNFNRSFAGVNGKGICISRVTVIQNVCVRLHLITCMYKYMQYLLLMLFPPIKFFALFS